MGPPRYRRRNFPANNRKSKPDHASYVRSLFEEFLRRNQKPPLRQQPPPPPEDDANRRPNLYRESIDRMLQQNQPKPHDSDPNRWNKFLSRQQTSLPVDSNRRPNLYRESIDRALRQNHSKQQDSGSLDVPGKRNFPGPPPEPEVRDRSNLSWILRQNPWNSSVDQPGIVKRFLETNAPKAVPEVDHPRPPLEPVCVRFKRLGETNQFVRCDMTPGAATPKGGLMRWLKDRKRERLERERLKRPKKVDEYMELPGDFFSGRPTLPFETDLNRATKPPVADKTLASIGSAFVPPVASTPLDRPFPVASICSPIISDPEEIAAKKIVAVPKAKIFAKREDLEFVKKFDSVLDSISRVLLSTDGRFSPLDRDYDELRCSLAARAISANEEPSMVINVQFGYDRRPQMPSSLAAMDNTGDNSFEREVLQLFTPDVIRAKRNAFELDTSLNSKTRPRISRVNDTSTVVQFGTDRKHTQTSFAGSVSPMSETVADITEDKSFEREVHQMFTPPDVKRAKRNDPEDTLLIYSPPRPIPPAELEHPPIRSGTCKTFPLTDSPTSSVSSQEISFMAEFLSHPRTPENVANKQPDASLCRAPNFRKQPNNSKTKSARQPEPDYSFLESQPYLKPLKPMANPAPEPDFSFLDNREESTKKQKQQQQDSESFFVFSQEDFVGPIFPSQDGPPRGSKDPFELTFSQAPDCMCDFDFD